MLTGRPAALAAIIRTATEMEPAWQGKVPQPEQDKLRYTPWMPFPIPRFISLAAEALPELEGNQALEIGAGIGTKMILLAELYGLDVHGIERVPEYVRVAAGMGLDVVEADALAWPHYSGYHLIWFNRVFRDAAAEAELEALVWRTVDPGTVVICANLEGMPPRSWFPVLDDWTDARTGIWQSPSVTAGS